MGQTPAAAVTQQYPIQQVRRRLLVLWLSGGLVLFGIVFLTTIPDSGAYATNAQTIWAWFGTNLGTTLATMLAVVAYDSIGTPDPKKPAKSVTRFFYLLMASISIFFLLMMTAPFFLRPILQFNLIDLLNNSKWWLGAVQSIVLAGTSLIFPKSGRAGTDQQTAAEQETEEAPKANTARK